MTSRPEHGWKVIGAALLLAGAGCGGGEAGGASAPATAPAAAPSTPAGSTPAATPAGSTPAATPVGSNPAGSSGAPAPGSPPGAAAPAVPAGLVAVGWLLGSWAGTTPDGAQVEETWSVDGAVLRGAGKTRTKAGKELVEAMRIEARDGGALVLVAQPDGAATPTEFTLDPKISGPSHATFVNDGHDWPTRIRYERAGAELKVRVRGRPGQDDSSWVMKTR